MQSATGFTGNSHFTRYCAIYARYSSTMQRQASIEDQIRNCRKYAASNDWIVLEHRIYSDRAMTAKHRFHRLDTIDFLRPFAIA